MLKQFFERLYAHKKAMRIIGSSVLVLLAVAVVVGLLNGLIADGTWSFGWSSYRYDETDFEIGSGTVYSRSITDLEIDWIDGEVKIVLCDDASISLTEEIEGEVADTALLRRRLSEDGTKLTVKYRASASFLGCGSTGVNKSLTVRIPKSMANLQSLTVTAESAVITSDGISATSFSVTSKTGDVTLTNGGAETFSIQTVSGKIDANISVLKSATLVSKRGDLRLSTQSAPSLLDLNTQKGNISISIPADCGFALTLDADTNRFACDRALSNHGEGAYSYGDGGSQIKLSAPKGSVSINTATAE